MPKVMYTPVCAHMPTVMIRSAPQAIIQNGSEVERTSVSLSPTCGADLRIPLRLSWYHLTWMYMSSFWSDTDCLAIFGLGRGSPKFSWGVSPSAALWHSFSDGFHIR
ncbi:hypothetical protein SARC_05175, partial [Sphaeroforma arctica JP610]